MLFIYFVTEEYTYIYFIGLQLYTGPDFPFDPLYLHSREKNTKKSRNENK